MDFLIVVSGLLDIAIGSHLSFVKVLRILRVMRPLKLITRVKGLRIVIASLFNALPKIMSLQLVVMFFMFNFSILMTTIFSGHLHSCNMDHLSTLSAIQQLELINTRHDCLNYGGEWQNELANFDNTFQSMLMIFLIQTRERHGEIMHQLSDSVGVDMQPKDQVNYLVCLLTIIIIVLFGILFFNMFVGVVVDVYKQEQDKTTRNNLLNKEQRMWTRVQELCYNINP